SGCAARSPGPLVSSIASASPTLPPSAASTLIVKGAAKMFLWAQVRNVAIISMWCALGTGATAMVVKGVSSNRDASMQLTEGATSVPSDIDTPVRNGKMHGSGRYTYADGSIYTG